MKLLLKIKNGTPPMRKVRLVVILIASPYAFVFSFVFRLSGFFTCLSMGFSSKLCCLCSAFSSFYICVAFGLSFDVICCCSLCSNADC